MWDAGRVTDVPSIHLAGAHPADPLLQQMVLHMRTVLSYLYVCFTTDGEFKFKRFQVETSDQVIKH